MSEYLDKIIEALVEVGIKHEAYHDCVHIQFPNNFGVLEIKVWNGSEDSIQLLGGDFHTHGELEAIEFSLPKEKAIAMLVSNILSGKYLLIEEQEPNKKPRKLVAQSLKEYLKYLPPGTEYEIANKI